MLSTSTPSFSMVSSSRARMASRDLCRTCQTSSTCPQPGTVCDIYLSVPQWELLSWIGMVVVLKLYPLIFKPRSFGTGMRLSNFNSLETGTGRLVPAAARQRHTSTCMSSALYIPVLQCSHQVTVRGQVTEEGRVVTAHAAQSMAVDYDWKTAAVGGGSSIGYCHNFG